MKQSEKIPEAKRKQELEHLCRRAENVKDSWQWEPTELEFSELLSEWKVLDPDGDHPLKTRFDNACHAFFDRFHEYLRKQESDAKETDEVERRLQIRLEICQKAEELIGQTGDDAELAIERLKQEWEAAPELTVDVLAAAAEKFEDACKAFHRERVRIERQRESDESRTQRLVRLCEKAEQWSSSTKWSKAAAVFDDLKQKWQKDYRADNDAIKPFHDRFKAATESFGSARKKAAEKVEKERSDAVAALGDICTRVETSIKEGNLTQSEDFIGQARDLFASHGAHMLKPELERLNRRMKKACEAVSIGQREQHAENKTEEWANLTAKEALCAEMEMLSNEEDMYKVASAVKEGQAQWEKIGHVPRKQHYAIEKQFRKTCNVAYGRCKGFFEALDKEREGNFARKKEIIKTIRRLMGDRDRWRQDNRIFHRLVTEIHSIGPVPKHLTSETKRRYEESCRDFKSARKSRLDGLQKEHSRMARQKEKLCTELEAFADNDRWAESVPECAQIESKWARVGLLPNSKEQPLQQRFDSARSEFRTRCDEFTAACKKQWADAVVGRVELLSVFEKILADGVAGMPADDAAAALATLLKGWQAIDPVIQGDDDTLHERFRQQVGLAFADAAASTDHQAALITMMEKETNAMAAAEITIPNTRSVRVLEHAVDTASAAFTDTDDGVTAARDALADYNRRWKKSFDDLRTQREAVAREKAELCARLEILAGIGSEDGDRAAATSINLADELRLAFESNFVISGGAEPGGARRKSREEADAIQNRWKVLPPLSPSLERRYAERFKRANQVMAGARERS